MSKLKYEYKENETPEERLRNKLQPFFYLASAVEVGEASAEIKEVATMCLSVTDDIINLLDDMSTLYHKVPMPIWTSDKTE